MDARQDVLIDMTPYLDNADTLLAAIEETEAEQRAEVERAVALVAAEETERAEGIRAMITADLPAGAAGRWVAMFATDTEVDAKDDAPASATGGPIEETEPVEDTRGYIPNVVSVRGGKIHMGTSHDDPFPFCRTGGQSSAGTIYQDTAAAVTCTHCAYQATGPLFSGRVEVAAEQDADRVDVDALGLSPSMRRCLIDLTGHMHPQTYQGLTARGLIRETATGIKLTALGKQVRAALEA